MEAGRPHRLPSERPHPLPQVHRHLPLLTVLSHPPPKGISPVPSLKSPDKTPGTSPCPAAGCHRSQGHMQLPYFLEALFKHSLMRPHQAIMAAPKQESQKGRMGMVSSLWSGHCQTALRWRMATALWLNRQRPNSSLVDMQQNLSILNRLLICRQASFPHLSVLLSPCACLSATSARGIGL